MPDVIVVGAGVIGLSTAFQLAKAGITDVTVVERSHLAAGATGKSGAIVRTHYTNEAETALAVESLTYFAHWGDLVGGECGFERAGLLVFAPRSHRADLETNVAMHQRLGANARLITASEAASLDPGLWVEDVDVVGYEADSGYADANRTAYSLAAAARALGVRLLLDTTVTQVISRAGKVRGVVTTQGEIAAPVVVVAAGAWANRLLGPMGVDLGMRPHTTRVSLFRDPPERTAHPLTVIDHIHNTWIRPHFGCTLIGVEPGGKGPEASPDAYAEAVTQDYIAHCHEQLVKRLPLMRQSTSRGNWAGIIMLSPDSRPVIDRAETHEGLFYMTGDSGTSFKTSPAIGKGLAEWITQGAPQTVNLSPFGAARLREGRPWRDAHDYGLGARGLTVSR